MTLVFLCVQEFVLDNKETLESMIPANFRKRKMSDDRAAARSFSCTLIQGSNKQPLEGEIEDKRRVMWGDFEKRRDENGQNDLNKKT